MAAGTVCDPCHWGRRWASRWDHETRKGCAELGAGTACEPCHWGLRWTSLWGHETCEGVCRIGGGHG
eukprot:8661928-Pyramimonas_sp.AAC.1